MRFQFTLVRGLTEIKNTRTLHIPFGSHKHAEIAKQVIEVDAELQPQAVKRTLEVRENMLIAYVRRHYQPAHQRTIYDLQNF